MGNSQAASYKTREPAKTTTARRRIKKSFSDYNAASSARHEAPPRERGTNKSTTSAFKSTEHELAFEDANDHFCCDEPSYCDCQLNETSTRSERFDCQACGDGGGGERTKKSTSCFSFNAQVISA